MTKMPNPELLNTRAKMIEIACKYPEAMKKGTGTFNNNGIKFPKGAYRLENGQRQAGTWLRIQSAELQQYRYSRPSAFIYDYGKVSSKENSLRLGGMKNCENVVATPMGVSIHLGFPCDKIMFDVYDIAGRIVLTKAIFNVQRTNAVFVPMNISALPQGHFIGCMRSFTECKTANSFLFPLNTMR